MRKHLLFLFLTLFSLYSFAQTGVDVDNVTDAQVEQFLKQAEERGLTEQEIEAAARMNGYTAEDIAKIRQRIERLKSGQQVQGQEINEKTRKQIGEVAERVDVQVDDKTEVGKKKEVFGRSIFQNKELSFEPNLNLATPPNYVLGSGDELKIDITGFAYQHYDARVSPEGTIQLESLSPFTVAGLTVTEAKEKIRTRLKTLFGGLRNGGLSLDVTLGDIKSIQVNIIGEVVKPGTYTLSGFAKLMNALYVCGGPNQLGSFRNIKLIRNNQEIAQLDVYELLTKGLFTSNPLLQDQDVIFVPLADKKVEIEGEVRRPQVFELKSNESLSDAVYFAGGFSEQAYQDKLLITRYTSKEKKLLEATKSTFDNTLLMNGDQILVEAVLDRYENKVEVLGAVFRPGTYALNKSLGTVGDLIRQAEGLREDAFKKRVLIQRENDNLDIETIDLDLTFADSYDFALKREDKLIIKSFSELREERTVSIFGAVIQEGEYEFEESLSVNDLIVLAGGLTEGAEVGNIEIARRADYEKGEDAQTEIIPFQTLKDLRIQGEELLLRPFDQVFVRRLANYKKQELVNISGEVRYPGSYAISRADEKIYDLIQRAGGLLPSAHAEGARFYKNGKLVALNLASVLKGNDDVGNLLLQEGDNLVIPKLEDFVKVRGEVLNPTIVAYDKSFDFNDYIAQAGGYSDSAFVRKAYVRYANGLTDRTKSFLGVKSRPTPQRGMEVVVPKRNKYRWTPAERIAVSSALVSVATIMVTIIRIL